MEMSWLPVFLAGAFIAALLVYLFLSLHFRGKRSAFSTEIDLLKNQNRAEVDKGVELNTEINSLRTDNRELHAELSSRNTQLQLLKERMQEQKQELNDLNQKFALEFKNLANEIFDEKSRRFTDQNKTNLDALLNPLREKLTEFQKQVADSNLEGAKRSVAFHEQIKSLKELNQKITAEAHSLTQALRGDSKVQGGWGEMQLESILQKAGLQKGIHYSKEHNVKTEEGSNQRLDFIINLPDNKHLVLDSKVSLTAYSKYFDSDTEEEKAAALKLHLSSMHNHIRSLGDKNYQSLYSINQPDYIMMFVANEPALTLALREDPELYDKALSRNIVLVSTTTLLATLRTISYIWNQDLQNKNAEEIARQAGALYDKFVSFTADLSKLGDQLGTVEKTYHNAMKKLSEGKDNLVRKTERIRELGAKTTKTTDPRLTDRSFED